MRRDRISGHSDTLSGTNTFGNKGMDDSWGPRDLTGRIYYCIGSLGVAAA